MSAGTAADLRWFEEVGEDDLALVGGKCSSLGELLRAGVRVPPGFALTTGGYARFMSESGVRADVQGLLKQLRPDDPDRLQEASAAIRARIEASSFSGEQAEGIVESYRRLSGRCGAHAIPVAVRSSATAEDLPGASFAGQYDTYLGVRGEDDLLLHVRRCISSLFTARAMAYRVKMGFPHERVAISVGVQEMIDASAAGVMFTLNAEDGDRSVISLDSNFGLGESVVSGLTTPDHFLVNKVTLNVVERRISRKETSITVDVATQRCVRTVIPAEQQTASSLLDEQLVDLSRIGKAIERHYSRPMDIEWAIDQARPGRGGICILQARPETVWSTRRAAAHASGADGAMGLIVQTLLTGRRVAVG